MKPTFKLVNDVKHHEHRLSNGETVNMVTGKFSLPSEVNNLYGYVWIGDAVRGTETNFWEFKWEGTSASFADEYAEAIFDTFDSYIEKGENAETVAMWIREMDPKTVTPFTTSVFESKEEEKNISKSRLNTLSVLLDDYSSFLSSYKNSRSSADKTFYNSKMSSKVNRIKKFITEFGNDYLKEKLNDHHGAGQYSALLDSVGEKIEESMAVNESSKLFENKLFITNEEVVMIKSVAPVQQGNVSDACNEGLFSKDLIDTDVFDGEGAWEIRGKHDHKTNTYTECDLILNGSQQKFKYHLGTITEDYLDTLTDVILSDAENIQVILNMVSNNEIKTVSESVKIHESMDGVNIAKLHDLISEAVKSGECTNCVNNSQNSTVDYDLTFTDNDTLDAFLNKYEFSSYPQIEVVYKSTNQITIKGDIGTSVNESGEREDIAVGQFGSGEECIITGEPVGDGYKNVAIEDSDGVMISLGDIDTISKEDIEYIVSLALITHKDDFATLLADKGIANPDGVNEALMSKDKGDIKDGGNFEISYVANDDSTVKAYTINIMNAGGVSQFEERFTKDVDRHFVENIAKNLRKCESTEKAVAYAKGHESGESVNEGSDDFSIGLQEFAEEVKNLSNDFEMASFEWPLPNGNVIDVGMYRDTGVVMTISSGGNETTAAWEDMDIDTATAIFTKLKNDVASAMGDKAHDIFTALMSEYKADDIS